ncbi:MAG: hypothetical protein GTN89_09260 [Acidobacteria bacterium]|nr:hypothetical protein [Acidobacteriota bacterium]NIM60542.1 hypothetical protein [Acidobacteriota bacterium]NIO59513.1 hypothetical protein [Acidobacteriota bacterium]NIQ30542.1 hypothetical protein [Acidobacteriota bacterium]NIQ85490.1 hypothetical protein [Acidobacteriota bacterium]
MIQALLPLALAGYVLGVVLATIGTVQSSRLAARGASIVFTCTWAVHTVAILLIGIDAGRVPLTNRFEYLVAFGWAIAGLYLYVMARHHFRVAGLVLPPLAALSVGGALAVSHPTVANEDVPGVGFLFHTSISTLGMAFLGVAFGMAIIYLAQDHALKSRSTPGLLQRLPALEECDHVGFQALIVGFILLTVGIGTGVAMNTGLHSKLLSGGAKQIFPLLAWGVFLVVLLARRWLGYRGRKSALLTIAGFLLGLATVVGMTL